MKKILLIIILLPLALSSQELPRDSNNKVTYEEVINVDNKDAKQIYDKALEWFVFRYNSANDVIQLKDELNNKIIGKGNFDIDYYARSPIIKHTIIVETKENKLRVIITDLIYEDIQNSKFNLEDFPKSWFGKKKFYNTMNSKALEVIEDLKKFINDNSKSKW